MNPFASSVSLMYMLQPRRISNYLIIDLLIHLFNIHLNNAGMSESPYYTLLRV